MRSTNSTSGGNAVDANPDTSWTATGDGSSPVGVLQFDFGTIVPIGAIRILPGPGGLLGQGTIEVSLDGTTWSTWGSVSATTIAGPDGWVIVTPVDDPPPLQIAQYVRIVYQTPNDGQTVGNLAELSVFP